MNFTRTLFLRMRSSDAAEQRFTIEGRPPLWELNTCVLNYSEMHTNPCVSLMRWYFKMFCLNILTGTGDLYMESVGLVITLCTISV